MKAVVTVLGKDRTGIIARVSNLLYEKGVNILDISQTILSDMFTMIMLVEVGQDSQYDEVRGALMDLAKEMGLEIRVQRSDIFDAMHRI
jgi:ACT domain-containing protein